MVFLFSNQVAKEWSHKWYGYFGFEEEFGIKPFVLEDYLDFSCPPDIRKKIVYYLKKSPVALVGFRDTVGKCKCGYGGLHSALYRSDGIWVWPDSLSHGVDRHNICIPNELLKRIIDADGIPPKEITVPCEDLPWPKTVGKDDAI